MAVCNPSFVVANNQNLGGTTPIWSTTDNG